LNAGEGTLGRPRRGVRSSDYELSAGSILKSKTAFAIGMHQDRDALVKKSTVATSPVELGWMWDSPRTGCAWRTTPYICGV